ncbi:MAG: hypothetical protein HKO57_07740 [Akkermansiaceae bacterium]|nr:hypothetical protein [Akkermansiaceae bacterium]
MTPAIAEDEPRPWGRVVFEVPGEDENAVVNVEGTKDLAKVTVKWGKQQMEVPSAEFSEINDPRLSTAELLFGEGYYGKFKEGEEPVPHVLVEMEFGTRSEFGTFASVKFLFHGGKYQERIVLTPTGPNTWTEYRKSPGKSPVETGTTTKLPR